MYKVQYRRPGRKKKYRKRWFSSVEEVEVRLRCLCEHHKEAVAVDLYHNVVGMVVAAGPCKSWQWWCNREALQK